MGRVLTRRELAAGITAGLLLGGCGGSGVEPPAVQVVGPLATPLTQVPGFDDPAKWSGRVVRVGVWDGEIQQALASSIFDPFSRLTGAIVTTFQADYDRLAETISAGASYLDLMLVDFTRVWSLAAAEVVQPLPEGLVDHDRFGRIGPTERSAPLYAYAMVNTSRRNLAETVSGPETWAEWGDLQAFPGTRSLSASPIGTLELALLASGVGADALYPLDVERALERLSMWSRVIGSYWWSAGDEPVVWLIQDLVQLAATWSYRSVAAQLDGRPIDFSWNQALLVADSWVVPAGSAASDVAADLIRFSLTDEVQSVMGYAAPLGPTITNAYRYIEPRQARRLASWPEVADGMVVLDGDWWSEHRESTMQRYGDWLETTVGFRP